MIKTYLVSPSKNTTNSVDLKTSECLKEFFEYKKIEFELLPWNIIPISKEMDEQNYDISSKDPNLDQKLSSGGFVVINTSGYTHSRTYFFQRALNVPRRIHIGLDAHADLWNAQPNQVGSDGFNAELMRLSNIDYGLFMGIVPNQNILPRGQSKEEIKQLSNKMNMFFLEYLEELNSDEEPWMRKTYTEIKRAFPKVLNEGLLGISKKINLEGRPAYLTIDLDIIQDYPTEWRGHGRLNEDLLNELITKIGKRYNIIGADICGFDIRHTSDSKPLESLVRIYANLKSVMN